MKKVKVVRETPEIVEDIAEETAVITEQPVDEPVAIPVETVTFAAIAEEPVHMDVKVEIPAAVSKVAQEPVLQLEEVARGFRQYRPHHLQAILSFCNARGYPLQGTKEQLLNVLRQFGW